MLQDEKREQIILTLADWMRNNPFTFEYKVVKKPKGIKIIYEVSQEEMDAMVKEYTK